MMLLMTVELGYEKCETSRRAARQADDRTTVSWCLLTMLPRCQRPDTLVGSTCHGHCVTFRIGRCVLWW